MTRRTPPLWGALIALMLALAACRPATPEAATSVPEPTAPPATVAPTDAPAEQATPAGEATAALDEPTTSAPTPVPGATLAPRPEPAWLIPELREDEWVKGPEDAGLTIVEYSDFQ